MIKLKDILSEAYAWERQEGKSLPTLAEVQAAYDARMREEAKPDFLDLDGDGDETESMKSAAADSTPHGNNIGWRRAIAQLKNNKDGSHIYGHKADGTVTKLNSPSDVDDVKYKNFTIKTESLAKAFNKRMLGNLHGHEYILREAFKRK
jgi:hypothetical protein